MTRLGQTEKEKKNSLRYYFCPKRAGEFLKKKKNHFGIIPNWTGLGQTLKEKKKMFRFHFCPNWVRAFLKKKEEVILASFLAEPSRNRLKKRKRKFSFQYHFYPNRVGAFLTNFLFLKLHFGFIPSQTKLG